MKLIQRFVTTIILATITVVQFLVGLDAQGQEIPRDEYLRYIPLESPTIVRQTAASVEMNLFGDITDSDQDVDPVDGINDHRHKVLLDLAVRFAPYLVLNSTMIPMDFRLFMERERAFLLFRDTWNLSRSSPEFVSSETINWQALGGPTSEGGSLVPDADSSDERLLSLLKAFDPFAPSATYHLGAVAPEGAKHQVMFFDFPGDGEEAWKQEYENQISKALPRSYEGFPKVFVHPFMESVRSSVTGHWGYAFVLQYWFFYPYNDGINNHEGDWEHINVFVKPLNKLHEPLSEADVRRILAGDGSSDTAPDRPVIQRVDYYFHHKVMTLDYTQPNVYQPWKKWKKELKNTREERFEEKWIWEQIRYRAYCDDDETIINTHPIGFIGGDNRGTDQLLEHPGKSNRASNGTYPFSGLYKNVGQVEAEEQISQRFDHREYFAAGDHKKAVPKGGYRRGSVVGFASPDRIEILPDAERVAKLVKEKAKAQARRDWAWLVLPIRWGYPATESPFAGAIAYTDLGNSSVLGPSYNPGWNRSGDSLGFQMYSPHTFGPLLPLTWRDSFANNLGYLNLPLSLVAALPPFDVSWRVISFPFRSFLGMPDRIFRPDGPIPYRFLSIYPYTFTRSFVHWSIPKLVLNQIQMNAIGDYLDDISDRYGSFTIYEGVSSSNLRRLHVGIALYLGERFSSHNELFVGYPNISYDLTFRATHGSEIPETFQLRGNLIHYEYWGSLRYNLTTGSLMVFLKGGYGRRWYGLKNISVNNVPFPGPNGPWVSKPTLKDLSTFLPNTLHVGGGIEWVPVRNIGVLLSGIDVGILGELLIYRNRLGIGFDTFLPTVSMLPTNGISGIPPYTFTQSIFQLALKVGF